MSEDQVKAVVDAWRIPGSHPSYHHEHVALLWLNWPSLARALEGLAAAERR